MQLVGDLKSVAEAISKLLHPLAEVVVHDLEANRIVHIFNALSGRKVGDPSLLDDLDGLDRGRETSMSRARTSPGSTASPSRSLRVSSATPTSGSPPGAV
jgi:predicted transcriptional regulator YheO